MTAGIGEPNAAPALRKLPVWQIVSACCLVVAHNLGQLVRISWLLLLIFLLVLAASDWLDLTWPTAVGQFAISSTIVPAIVSVPVLASIAVAWHRLILLQERVTRPVYFRLDSVVWQYALLSLVPLVLSGGMAMGLSFMRSQSSFSGHPLSAELLRLLIGLVDGIFVICLFLILARVSLVLPATAIGERLSLREAWHMTRGNTLRLAAATLLCMCAAVVCFLPLAFFADVIGVPLDPVTPTVVGLLIAGVAYAVVMIFAATLLSLAYRFFAAPREDRPTAPSTEANLP